MKNNTKLTSLILAMAAACGLALSAAAQSADVTASEPAQSDSGLGLLGTGYSSVSFLYWNLDNGPPSAMRGAAIDFNQPLQAGVDFNLGYSWGRASAGSARLTRQSLMAGVTVYSKVDWGKPFVQILAGWDEQRGYAASGNAFGYTLGTGVELQVAPRFALTPYLNFVRAVGFNRSEFDWGLKGTYRLNRQWSLTPGVQYESVYHAKDATRYLLGVNYHY